MRYTLEDTLKHTGGVMVIDGSMSTALENMGCDLNNKLWTAKILAEQPAKIKAVHTGYFNSGADSGITASYQASFKGLMENGYSEAEAEAVIQRSVELFLEAREEWMSQHTDRTAPLCLAGIGPYGAYLADGSEYRGHYGVSDEVLYAFHQKRAEVLWKAGADLLLFETQPSLHEALIEAEIAEKLQADYMISFSCADGIHTNEGQKVSECTAILSQGHPHLHMLSVNCTKPKYISSLIHELKKGTDLPIAVYPNSGEIYDPATKTWERDDEDTTSFEDYAFRWMCDGASAVGGCCTTVEKHVRQIVSARRKFYEAGCPKTIVR